MRVRQIVVAAFVVGILPGCASSDDGTIKLADDATTSTTVAGSEDVPSLSIGPDGKLGTVTTTTPAPPLISGDIAVSADPPITGKITAAQVVTVDPSEASCPDREGRSLASPSVLEVTIQVELSSAPDAGNPNLNSAAVVDFDPQFRLVLNHGGDNPPQDEAFLVSSSQGRYAESSVAPLLPYEYMDVESSCIVNMTYSTQLRLQPGVGVVLRLRTAAFLPAGFDISNYQLGGVVPCRDLPSLAPAPDGCQQY
jgi:hypothetical protein